MAAINTFTIVGNVTKDVELRFTTNKTPTTTYSVAVNRDSNECDFIPVTTYGKQAENDAKYLKKGSRVEVVGCIRSWSKPTENKRGFNFEAKRVQYLGKPAGNSGANNQDAGANHTSEHDDWTKEFDTAQGAAMQPSNSKS